MIKAVYFDYGGVLTPGGKTKVSKEVPAKYFGVGIDDVQISDLDESLRKNEITITDFFKRLSLRHGTGRAPLTEETYKQNADIFVRNGEVYQLAEALRSQGILTGILSNVTTLNSRLLAAGGYYDGFDPVVLSCNVGVKKPDKKIYEAGLQQFGFHSAEVLLIDDQEACLETAREIGMQVLQAASPRQVNADVRQMVFQQNGIKL